jgi:cation diffusion facilitator CzcD-associated flavoprotein CzcO
METNTWTDTTINSIGYDEKSKTWSVDVVKSDGSRRVLKPKQVVMAQGFGGGYPRLPSYPGMASYLCALDTTPSID